MAALTGTTQMEMTLEGNRRIVFLTFANGSTGADTLAVAQTGLTTIEGVALGGGGSCTTTSFPATSLAITTTGATGSLMVIGY
jgi:hypothetical protein